LQESAVEGDGDAHGSYEPPARDDRDLARRREARRPADREAVDRMHLDVARVLEQVDEARQVARLDLPLEDRRPGDRGCFALRAVEPLLVVREHRAEAGLQPGVDAPRLALAGDAREA